jgi:hypothetical protein
VGFPRCSFVLDGENYSVLKHIGYLPQLVALVGGALFGCGAGFAVFAVASLGSPKGAALAVLLGILAGLGAIAWLWPSPEFLLLKDRQELLRLGRQRKFLELRVVYTGVAPGGRRMWLERARGDYGEKWRVRSPDGEAVLFDFRPAPARSSDAGGMTSEVPYGGADYGPAVKRVYELRSPTGSAGTFRLSARTGILGRTAFGELDFGSEVVEAIGAHAALLMASAILMIEL